MTDSNNILDYTQAMTPKGRSAKPDNAIGRDNQVDSLVTEFLKKVTLGEITQFEHMAAVPLFGPTNGPYYLTLTEAIADGLLSVSEIDKHGSVPQLRVDNQADLPVLLLDGEELAGAKQNRVLNTTILVKANSTTIIPVSCTEQGRWSYNSPTFADSGYVMPPRARRGKTANVSASLSNKQGFQSDQGEVWSEVHEIACLIGAHSKTGAMRDIYESRRTSLDDYLKAFPIADGQTGVLVMIDGAPVGLDIVSRPEAFERIGPKLITSYAMEALLSTHEKPVAASINTALRFVSQARASHGVKYDSVGHGTDLRFASAHVVGSALVYNEHVIHAAFFPRDNDSDSGHMSGPSNRRMFRM